MSIRYMYILFIPHCQGNGLVAGGIYLQYTCYYLMGSWIYHGFMDIRQVHRYTMGSWIYARKVNWLSNHHMDNGV